MSNRFLGLILSLVILSPSLAVTQNFWQQTNGPEGGVIYATAINSTGVFFAGTVGGGLFRSVESTTEVMQTGQPACPSFFTLEQNYPNPFNPATSIRYRVLKPAHTTIKIYSIGGREMKTLTAGGNR